jgi:peroxiredoxin
MVKTASTMMALGTTAPDFTLPDTDGSLKSLHQCKGDIATVIVFMCNHCPYVKHVAPQLAKISTDYVSKGVRFIGISSNDIATHPDDSPERMRDEAKAQGYAFPYLYDESQSVANAYRAACTPDFFVFDAELKLVYRGQLDDSRPKTDRPLTGKDLRQALDAIIANEAVSPDQHPSIGCNIKWKPGMEPDYFYSAQVK